LSEISPGATPTNGPSPTATPSDSYCNAKCNSDSYTDSDIYAYIDADSNHPPNFYTKTYPDPRTSARARHHRIKNKRNKSDRNK